MDECKAEAVVDHGEPAEGQCEALAIGARDMLSAAVGRYGSQVSAESLAAAASSSCTLSGASPAGPGCLRFRDQ
ncbi:MAG TPA: hypothetical protein VKC66_20840 [Xanthobacteraceae bacterium]|nr:hypothetical protein [Xanthobacteraceae bacterium]